jgi:RNA polymerase sigma factor (sigma-70 family)
MAAIPIEFLLNLRPSVIKTIIYWHKRMNTYATEQDIESILEDIRFRALTTNSEYDPKLLFLPWIRKIAKNCTLDYINKKIESRQRFVSIFSAGSDGKTYETILTSREGPKQSRADYQTISDNVMNIIIKALEDVGLGGEILLKQYCGYNDKEIAEQLGISHAAVRVIKHRARKALSNNQRIISLCREYGISA